MSKFAAYIHARDEMTAISNRITKIFAENNAIDDLEWYRKRHGKMPDFFVEDREIYSADDTMVTISVSYWAGNEEEKCSFNVPMKWYESQFRLHDEVEAFAKDRVAHRLSVRTENELEENAKLKAKEIAELTALAEKHPEALAKLAAK